MDVPYFIKEHLWMTASDEATLKKFLTEVKFSKFDLENKIVPQLWLLRWFSKLLSTEEVS